MALLFCDSFDHYVTADLAKKWSGHVGSGTIGQWSIVPQTTPTTFPPGGGQVLRQDGSSNGQGYLYKNFAAAKTGTIICGGWFMWDQVLPTSDVRPIALLDSGTEQLSVQGDGAGHLRINRGATVLATGTATISVGTWYHIELAAKIHNSTGTYELRINGVVDIALTTGVDTAVTANNQATAYGIGCDTSGRRLYSKGIVLADDSGSVFNTFAGPVKVACLRPVAPGNYSQWTPNDSVNFEGVNDQLLDQDVTFNQSGTANQIDTFAFDDSGIVSGTIYGIQHVLGAKQDAGAARTVAALQRAGGTDYPGTTQGMSGSYAFLLDAQSVNPATGNGFTVSEIDALEAGYKLIS